MVKLCKTNKTFFFVCLYFVFSHFSLTANQLTVIELSKIELVGTVTGKHALAILRIDNKTEGIYQLNQKILSYTIKSISKKSVELVKYNKVTTLTLVPVKNRKFYGFHSNSDNKAILATYEYRINRNTFDSLAKDTQSWLDNIGMEMHLDNGYFTGYKITYIKKNSPAELLGLAKGDIIKGVDNFYIKQNAEKFIKQISQLSTASQFILNMSHDNTNFNLKFLIEENK